MMPDGMREMVGKYFAAWCARDPAALAACFDEEGTTHQPYGALPLRGRPAIREALSRLLGAFASVEVTADHLFVAKDRAAAKFSGRGAGKNGRQVRLEGITIFEFTDAGLIRTLWGYWDPEQILAQLRS